MGIATITDIGVAVVTGFTVVNAVVAAAFHPANPITAITGNEITVVAAIDARLHDIIATNSHRTGIEAGIGIDPIAIVAALITVGTGRQIIA